MENGSERSSNLMKILEQQKLYNNELQEFVYGLNANINFGPYK